MLSDLHEVWHPALLREGEDVMLQFLLVNRAFLFLLNSGLPLSARSSCLDEVSSNFFV